MSWRERATRVRTGTPPRRSRTGRGPAEGPVFIVLLLVLFAAPAVLIGPPAALAQIPGQTGEQAEERALDPTPDPAPGQTPERLTLDAALERAEAHNPGYRQVTGELELNALERREQWLSVLPQPRLDLLTTSMAWNRQRVAEGFFGEVAEREEAGTIHTSRTQQGAGLSLTVDLGQFFEFQGLEDQARVREYGATAHGRELRVRVTAAFLDLQERSQALELEEELLEMARTNRDLAQRLYALARRDRIDLVSMELELAEQEDALEQSRTEMESARLALRTLIGDPDLGPFALEPVSFDPFDPGELDEEALVRAVRSTSPRIQQAEARLRAETRTMTRTRARWIPTLSLSAGATRQGFVQGGDAFFDLSPQAGWDRSFSLALRFPDLGQYFGRQNEQRRNEVAVRGQEEVVRETRAEVEQEVRELLNDLRAGARTLRTQERRTGLAEEQVELAREAYRIGRLSYLELQEAQSQAAESRRQALAARYALERARIELEAVLGSPL
jgi:outer membrane protein TolC